MPAVQVRPRADRRKPNEGYGTCSRSAISVRWAIPREQPEMGRRERGSTSSCTTALPLLREQSGPPPRGGRSMSRQGPAARRAEVNTSDEAFREERDDVLEQRARRSRPGRGTRDLARASRASGDEAAGSAYPARPTGVASTRASTTPDTRRRQLINGIWAGSRIADTPRRDGAERRSAARRRRKRGQCRQATPPKLVASRGRKEGSTRLVDSSGRRAHVERRGL